MDWYPLWNSLRIALVSCAAVFFLGIFAAYYIAKLPRTVKGALDVVLVKTAVCLPVLRHLHPVRLSSFVYPGVNGRIPVLRHHSGRRFLHNRQNS